MIRQHPWSKLSPPLVLLIFNTFHDSLCVLIYLYFIVLNVLFKFYSKLHISSIFHSGFYLSHYFLWLFKICTLYFWALLVVQIVKNLPAMQETWVLSQRQKRKWQPPPVFLPGESHRQRILVEYSLWGCKQ